MYVQLKFKFNPLVCASFVLGSSPYFPISCSEYYIPSVDESGKYSLTALGTRYLCSFALIGFLFSNAKAYFNFAVL